MGSSEKQIPMLYNGLFGGTAGAIATVMTHPCDLLKVRAQTQKSSMLSVTRQIMSTQGVPGFYRGLTASILRQYTSVLARFGIFYSSFEWYQSTYGTSPSIPLRLAFASVAGAVGGIVGNPADVVLIRTMADGSLPLEKRRNYTHVFNGLHRIATEEGVRTWWSGVGATINRSVVVSMSLFATYSTSREILLPHLGENIGLHFVASMITGFVTSLCSLPVDILKTRIQNAPKKISQLIVLASIMKNEGLFTLWRGFLPNFARLGPQSVLHFMILEQIRNLYFSSRENT